MTRIPIDPTREREAADGAAPAGRLAGRVRLADEGERAALERLWSGLELPPPAAPPPGFARRVAGLAATGGERPPAGALFGAAPRWAAALLFAAGIALGALVSTGLASEDSADAVEAEESLADSTLAAHYLDSVDDDAETAGPAPGVVQGEAP